MTTFADRLFDLTAASTAISSEAVEHGEIFTRGWVVNLILDLVGYTADRDLASLRAVEPACGSGAFLGPMVERLSRSCRERGRALSDATDAIRALDLLPRNVDASSRLVQNVLINDGWSAASASKLAAAWVRQGDYLLQDREYQSVDVVVGNPPYIRLEDVPYERMLAYRDACPTMIGRSDIYVGFYEVALVSLVSGGLVGFICADRWMRNQYGRDLRRLIAEEFSVETIISMHNVDVFEQQVSAYPAISIIRRERQRSAVVANTTRAFDSADAGEVYAWIRKKEKTPVRDQRYEIAELPHWFEGDDPWPAGSPTRLALIEHLNDRFPPLEDRATGTRVGIGVATGADSVFVTNNPNLVERECLLPLSMVRDTSSGYLQWTGQFLVNPWAADGRLSDLSEHPRLRKYYEQHADILSGRYVGRRPGQWYRTIDKVDHALTARPKLLFPDMKMTIHPVYDDGGFYPHHNLYYVVSDGWDLRVLGGLLLSRVAEAFVDAYAVKMRGGTLRFQAQYLRRIRVPHLDEISFEDRIRLAEAFERRDIEGATVIASRLYGIDDVGDI
jgi:adenine-specific DNA-methyltransferase